MPAKFFPRVGPRSVDYLGNRRKTPLYQPYVVNEKGETVSWVPLDMPEHVARKCADGMVAKMEAKQR
jgi:hypothetical protein